MTRIGRSPIASILMTDSVEGQPEQLSDKVHVISVAPLFAEAIRRIHQGSRNKTLMLSRAVNSFRHQPSVPLALHES